MATLEIVRTPEQEPIQATHDTIQVMENALGKVLSESEVIQLGFDLLELFDALMGEYDDNREGS